jgi:S-adenosylmethionine synthetase
MTKYDMTRVIGEHFKLSINHIKPDSQAPPKPRLGETARPGNTQLSTQALKQLGIDVNEEKSFAEWASTL